MHNLKILFSYLGAYRRDAILGVFFVSVETVLELFIPVIMANIIDVGVPAGDINYMLLQGAYMLVCAALSLVLGLGYARTSARVASGLGANLREAEYKKIQSLAFGNLDNYDASSLVTRMTTDITVIQNAVGNGFRPMVRGPVTLIVGLIYALMLSRPLATVFAIILPVLAIVLGVITYRVSPLYRQLQTSMDHLNGVVQEDLTAVRAVKAYVRTEHEEAKFDTVNTELAGTATKTFGSAVLNLPVFQLSMYVAALSILWIGGRMILAGKLGVGSLTGFMSYVLLIMNSLMMISNVFLLLTRALTSVGRIAEVLDEEPFIANPAGDLAIAAPADGSIEFRDVSFKYRADAAEDVLEHIDLRIESGSTVGILGGTGSGKSSLVQLIARLYDATEGAVLVGGRDVRDYDLATLRDAVGIVLQKNVLFTGTVRENLQWGNPQASDVGRPPASPMPDTNWLSTFSVSKFSTGTKPARSLTPSTMIPPAVFANALTVSHTSRESVVALSFTSTLRSSEPIRLKDSSRPVSSFSFICTSFRSVLRRMPRIDFPRLSVISRNYLSFISLSLGLEIRDR